MKGASRPPFEKALKEMLVSVFALLLALVVAGIVIALSGRNPLLAFHALLYGAIGNPTHLTETINRTTPLILTGLAVAFAFRCGLFNIGGEGQYITGGFAAVWAGFSLHGLPAVVHVPICLMIGAIVGGLWGMLAAFLKARFGVHEVISTIMLNWVGRFAVAFLVNNPYKDASGQGTLKVEPSSVPPTLFGTDISSGIFLALALAGLIWFILYRTWVGYEVKAVGFSPLAAEYGGIDITKNMLLAMFVSGALAALAGSVDYLGVTGRVPANVDFSGKGFDGIAVALIGKNEPLAIVFAALIFGALSAGNGYMQLKALVPKDMTAIVQGLIIIFMVAPDIVRGLLPFLKQKQEGAA